MTVATTKPAAGCRGGRRYKLLLALWDSEYAKKVYRGYYNVFVAAFGGGAGEGERWDCFRVTAGELPAPEDLAKYDAFVVSGSPHDVRRRPLDPPPVRSHPDAPRHGEAGHRRLLRPPGFVPGVGWKGWQGAERNGRDVGVKKVTFVQDLDGVEFLGDLGKLPSSASLVEVHQDEVWEIPPRAKVLTYSEKTRVEVFAVGEHALGIQGHPEYTTDILHNLIDRLTSQSAIQASVGEDARRRPAGRTARSGRRSARGS